ncbi:DUF2059 domain-containing protein [Microbulbifer variabilis]|uniref:DUF2059 domain-containing protein n=1 Tax=Microbulbifer variabilis TaxID=266805 RepID=UPI001CFD2181|nr:DUF2059 domain-containing protein [Microbulbifer variabilis]
MKNILFLITFISMGVNAQQPKVDLAMELIAIMDFDSQTDVIVQNLSAMQVRQLEQFDIPEKAKPLIREYMEDTNNLLFSTFQSEEVKRQYADLYASVFSEEELKSILAFYKSDHGKAFSKSFPEIVAGITKISEAQVQSVLPQLAAIDQEFKEKLKGLK